MTAFFITLTILVGLISIYVLINSVNLIIDTIRAKKDHIQQSPIKPQAVLTFDEVNSVIDAIVNEIWTNKYEITYTLKDLRVIPKLDQEIRDITKDILNAFSDDFKQNVYRYYSKEYFIILITRKAQYLTIAYTKDHKPSSK